MRPEAILAAFRVPLRPAEREFSGFSNTALHGFVCYVPQALAIAVGRFLTPSVLGLFYSGRLANALAAAALLGLAVGTAPFFRPVFFLAGLLPMAVFLAGSLSGDAVTNGLAFVLTAFVLRCAFGEKARMQTRDVAILILLAVLLALAKPGYLLLAGLAFLIPKERFGSLGRYGSACSLVVLSSVAATVLWAAALRAHGVVGMPAARPTPLPGGPAGLVLEMLLDYIRRAPVLAVQFVGKLGWSDVSLPISLVVLHGVLILFVALTGGRGAPDLTSRERWLVAAVVAGTLLVVAAPFYFTLRAPGPEGASAHHPQGRYLLPLGPAAFLLLCNQRWTFEWEGRRVLLGGWTALVLALAVFAVVVRYYF